MWIEIEHEGPIVILECLNGGKGFISQLFAVIFTRLDRTKYRNLIIFKNMPQVFASANRILRFRNSGFSRMRDT